MLRRALACSRQYAASGAGAEPAWVRGAPSKGGRGRSQSHRQNQRQMPSQRQNPHPTAAAATDSARGRGNGRGRRGRPHQTAAAGRGTARRQSVPTSVAVRERYPAQEDTPEVRLAMRRLAPEDRDMARAEGLSAHQVEELADLLDSVRKFERVRLRELQEARESAEAGSLGIADTAAGAPSTASGRIEEVHSIASAADDEAREVGLVAGNVPEKLAAALRSGSLRAVAGRAVDGVPIAANEYVLSLEEMMDEERAKRELSGPILPIHGHEVGEVLAAEGALDLVVLDVSDKCTFTRFMVFASGRSRMHMLSMADLVVNRFGKRIRALSPELPCNVEGRDSDEWMSVDCGETVVHVMSEPGRRHWKLDQMWKDRPSLGTASEAPTDAMNEEALAGVDEYTLDETIKFAQMSRKQWKKTKRRRAAAQTRRFANDDEEIEDFGTGAPLTRDFYESDDEENVGLQSADDSSASQQFYRR